MKSDTAKLFKDLPSVDKLLSLESLKSALEHYGHNNTRDEARNQIQSLRQAIASGTEEVAEQLASKEFLGRLSEGIVAALERRFSSSLKPVFNLTGTVVHTNLGRAALPASAIAAMTMAASEATNLEFDLATGVRGDRDAHLETALCEITGAEAATVVNNNAAAVLLMLNTLAWQREVPISRGELVEIGGAFRIPEIMKSAGCILKEIGTTNRTHLADYAGSLNQNTALLMKVHTSNYEIKGFTKTVPEQEIAHLAQRNKIPFIVDLGSGTLLNLQQFGLPAEPTVAQTLAQGADLISFSGDKLLGGPQAGIIVGARSLIDRIKANPMKRALRVDKITLAALLEVINLYRDPQRLPQRLPILADLTRPVEEIKALAQQLQPIIQATLGESADVQTISCKSQIGSGALPLDLLPGYAIAIRPLADKGNADARLQALAKAFRELPRPVLGRLHDGALILDMRCLRKPQLFVEQLGLIVW